MLNTTGGFSGAVKLADVDDFITPEQDCVIQPIGKPEESTQGSIKLELEDTAPPAAVSHFDQIRTDQQNKTAKITLADCLACSGCVTTAETMLVEQQSLEHLLTTLESSQYKAVVASLSPQSITSLAVKWNTADINVFTEQLIEAVKHYLHADYVIMTSSWPLDLVLTECRDEFIQRFQSQEDLPVIAGECPGWVCYAEKTQHDALKHISKVKSPQQVCGAIVRRLLTCENEEPLNENDVFHFTVMPCFDKKLEGTRDADIDTVLSTVELGAFLEEQGWTPTSDINTIPNDHMKILNSFSGISWPDNSVQYGSGGYFEHVFRQAALQLYNVDLSNQPLEYEYSKRNSDLKTAELKLDGEVKLRFAKAYGFRNIQNMMRRMKTGGTRYDYIEIMACPSGCLNGGGQVPAQTPSGRKSIKAQKELLIEVERAFESTSGVSHSVQDRAMQTLTPILHDRSLLYTSFSPVMDTIGAEVTPSSSAIKW